MTLNALTYLPIGRHGRWRRPGAAVPSRLPDSCCIVRSTWIPHPSEILNPRSRSLAMNARFNKRLTTRAITHSRSLAGVDQATE